MLSCRPVEAETQLPYAALGDLLAAVPERELAALPEPQRHALEVALLRAEPREPLHAAGGRARAARRAAGGADRGRRSTTSSGSTTPSEVVLAFVARRLEGTRVGLLVARRGGGELPLHLPEAGAGRRSGPLAPAELARVLAARRGAPIPRPS